MPGGMGASMIACDRGPRGSSSSLRSGDKDGDLYGFAVEAINKLSQGFILYLDDGLEYCLGLWVSLRRCERTDDLVLQVSPQGD